ncbi:MAG: IS3 family transposase [Synergistaceae bacterium]|nr:IS3 family transposase [Synergistaceae bacterium]
MIPSSLDFLTFWFHTLYFTDSKKKAVHWAHFKTRERARQAMFAYINGFYNTRRAQKRLDYLSPLEWFKNWYRIRKSVDDPSHISSDFFISRRSPRTPCGRGSAV